MLAAPTAYCNEIGANRVMPCRLREDHLNLKIMGREGPATPLLRHPLEDRLVGRGLERHLLHLENNVLFFQKIKRADSACESR